MVIQHNHLVMVGTCKSNLSLHMPFCRGNVSDSWSPTHIPHKCCCRTGVRGCRTTGHSFNPCACLSSTSLSCAWSWNLLLLSEFQFLLWNKWIFPVELCVNNEALNLVCVRATQSMALSSHQSWLGALKLPWEIFEFEQFKWMF